MGRMLTRVCCGAAVSFLLTVIYVFSYAPAARIFLDPVQVDGAWIAYNFEQPPSTNSIPFYWPVERLHEAIWSRQYIGLPLRCNAKLWNVETLIEVHSFFRVQKRVSVCRHPH